MRFDSHMPQRTGSKIPFRCLLFRCQHSCLNTSDQHVKWRSCLASITVTGLRLQTGVDFESKVTEGPDKRIYGKTHGHTCKQTNMRTRQTQYDLPFS